MKAVDAICQLDDAVRSKDARIAELEKKLAIVEDERDRALEWLASVGIGLSFDIVPADGGNAS